MAGVGAGSALAQPQAVNRYLEKMRPILLFVELIVYLDVVAVVALCLLLP